MNLSDVIFAPAWWMLVIGVIAVGALLYLANKRLDKTLRNAGFGALLLLAVWAVTSHFVVTPREAARDGTGEFVAAVVARDQLKMSDLLAPSATLGAFTKPDILNAGKQYADKWGLSSALITGSEMDERGTQIACTVSVFSQHESSSAPGTMRTDWRFIWGKTSQGWKIVQIEPIRIGGEDVSGIVSRYFTDKP